MPEIDEAEWRELARRQLPKKAVDELFALGELSLALDTRPMRLAAGHESRLGGRPKVSPEFSWPRVEGRALSLLSVLDLTRIGPLDPARQLPTSGYLDVFFDVAAYAPPGTKPCVTAGMQILHAASGLFEERHTPSGAVQYPAVAVEPLLQWSFPHPNEPIMAGLVERYGAKLGRLHHDLLEEVGQPRHRLFGWPDLIGAPITPSLPKLRSGAWRMLLQLDSDDELEWSWGNLGRLTVWIPDRDLPKARFDRCRVVLESY